ncbi:uncharacterized protein LOC123317795 [Coccinella septempunctata]|uniref:uncharacterized protein LOC123315522 n=2 Tax=Coccinella septempunctata TaxID=41139 RepID=UPI001D067403|nr:uncharacterized protein LOC123315522 [Coccinella septempunctata]XP_044760340.1 uncharacterized protein LOC123317795 [Coccinella septempunctata]
MLSNNTFNLYQPVNNDESITKVETRTYLPFVKSFGNNDTIEITINRADTWVLMHDAALIIKGKLQKTAGNGTVQLVLNGGAFLFDTISYELHGTEVDSVRDPGLISTIKGYLCYDKDSVRELETASWSYPDDPKINADGNFVFRIPLRHVLNFFDDYRLAICGKQTIRLMRSQNDNNAMKITPGPEETVNATKGKFTIDSIELKVKHIYPNDVLKIELLESMKSNRAILFPFRKWEIHELPTLTANSLTEIWNIKTTSIIDYPRFIICCFQTNKKNKSTENSTLFDNLDISNVRLLLNGEFIPQENLRLNFNKNDYAEAYYNYTEFSTSYNNLKINPILQYSDFKNRCLFVIDCSRRSESFKSSTVDVKLEIESRVGFPTSTKAYCIIVYDCVMEYLPLTETVRKLTSI